MFRTCDHYSDEYPINKIVPDTCFICLGDTCLEDTHNLIQLKNYNLFIKFCNCKGIVHHSCLVTWLNTRQKCPICRCDYIKKYVHINEHIQFVSMYLLFCTPSLGMIFMSSVIFKLICFIFYIFFFIYCLYFIYWSVFLDLYFLP
jgi:hypothetical protein